MHDPLVVAFEIRRPWPQRSTLPAAGSETVRWRIRLHHTHVTGCEHDPPHREGAFPWWKPSSYASHSRLAGRDYYWPPLITVWHREPGGRDALSVCRKRIRRSNDTWKLTRGWRLHVHHWKFQIHAYQALRRRLLTRCAWCGGRSLKGDAVNVSLSWDGPRGRWWQGERGLHHMDCSGIAQAHACCTCDLPVLDQDGYGRCARCNRFRPYGLTPKHLERTRDLQSIPAGERRAPDQPQEPTP